MLELVEEEPVLFSRLDAIAHTMCKEREDALRERQNSGLDDIWRRAREQDQGIDEVNRSRSDKKSETLDGPLTTLGKVDHENRSTVFLNITRPYRSSAISRVTDIYLPIGDKMPWGLKQTPVSELAILDSVLSEFPEVGGLVPPELAVRIQRRADGEALEIAKKYITDSLIETKWATALRDLINESGLVGTGILKGPFPKQRKLSPEVDALVESIAALSPMAHSTLELRLRYQPAAEVVKVENFVPDPACGTDIQNGKFVWEKIPNQSKKQVAELLHDRTYFGEQIERVLEEEPKEQRDHGGKQKGYTIWIRTGHYDLSGLLPQDLLDSIGFEKEEAQENEISPCSCFGQLTFINDHIVKVAKLPLDSTSFPYRVVQWEPRPGSWTGIGVPEQVETPQRGLNMAVRAGNDNLAFSVGFMLLYREGLVEPFPGDDWSLHPYKKWRVVAEELGALVGKELKPEDAFKAITFPNHLQLILPWIDFWLRMAEQTTGLPLLLQGQRVSDSVGVTQQLTNNATATLRLFVSRMDDNITTPFIQDCYSWVQKYGPEEAKGDAVAFALGSASLVVRETQLQALMQFGDRVVNPVFNKSPKKYADLFLEANQLDPRLLDMDEMEMQSLQAQAEAPDPKVEVAQIRAQTDQAIAEMKAQLERMKIEIDAQYKGAQLETSKEIADTQLSGKVAAASITSERQKMTEQQQPTLPPSSEEPSDDQIENALVTLGL